MKARRCFWAALGLGLFGAVPGRAAPYSVDLLTLFKAMPVPPALQTAAGPEFPLHDLRWSAGAAQPEPGDEVTALVTLASLSGHANHEAWLVRLRLKAREGPAKAPEQSLTLYTSAGDAFSFQSAVSPMELTTLGPVGPTTAPDQPVENQHRTISVRSEFLQLDLSGAARVVNAITRYAATHAGSHLNLNVRGRPFPPAEVEADHAGLTALGLAPADARSFAGSLPALNQFLAIVRNTPDLQGILLRILEKPSLLDVIRHGHSDAINFQYLLGGPSPGQDQFWPHQPAPEFSLLVLNLEIFGKPALSVALFVTPPRPPLEVSAGIVAVAAWRPGQPDQMVLMKLLAARPGMPATAKPQ